MTQYIDLRSDTVTQPNNQMKQFMFDAPIGDDVYGEDPSVNLLEEKASSIFGKEDALFVSSGTMANLISVLSHCQRGDEILLGDQSHIFKYEAGGTSVLGGVHSHQLVNNENGTIDIDKIIAAVNNTQDTHYALTKLLCLENTHNRCYGAAINNEYFADVKKAIKEHGIKLHIDGARIFNASVALNVNLDVLTQDADSISCCLSKGLSCPAGSLIIGNKNFIAKARRLRKMLGGGMRQAGILAAAGIYALDHTIERLKDDHNNAQELASGISEISNIEIDLNKISTNLIFFKLQDDSITDSEFIQKLKKYNIKIDDRGNRLFRMATHSDFTNNDIEKVIKTFKLILMK